METARLTQATLKTGKTSLTFLHGLGLKMKNVSLEHAELRVEAGHVNINVRLLPLLLGKIEISTLDVHDARFHMRSMLLDQTSLSGLATLPVQRIRLIRAKFNDFDGNPLLDDVRLDLRNLGPEHEALWELRAEQGTRSLDGHGSLDFHHGEVRGGFGKLKFNDVPLTWVTPLASDAIRPWFDNPSNHLNGSLTLDLKENQAWSIFGEVLLSLADSDRTISLRGKLHHPAENQYFWDDSFIRFDEQSVVTTKGECFQLECKASIAAKSIPLTDWQTLLPGQIGMLQMLQGSSDVNAAVQWQEGQWQATGDLLLKGGSFHSQERKRMLPELYFDQATITGSAEQWQAEATLSVAEMYGKIGIRSDRQPSGETETELQTAGIERIPPALLEMLLVSLEAEPGLTAQGALSGNIRLKQKASGAGKLELAIVADQAAITYPSWVKKQAGIAARCEVSFGWQDQGLMQPESIQLQNCQLGNSTLATLRWQRQDNRIEIGGLDVDLATLRSYAVRLPTPLQQMGGRVSGQLNTSWSSSEEPNWLDRASGQLFLSDFGPDSWQASGELTLNAGSFKSSGLQLKGRYGQAELQGEYLWHDRRGSINILNGGLDWNSLPPLPDSWRQMQLAGEIRQGRVGLLDNELLGISGRYRLQQGTLKLKGFNAQLASGIVTSPELSLTPNEAGLSFKGHIRAEEVQLAKLSGLDRWLQADLGGKLHLNLDLHGQLPAGKLMDWQYSNGDVLVYNGSWQRRQAESLPERLGIRSVSHDKYRFSQLSFRFRLQNNLVDISRISLQQGDVRHRGVAGIDRDGRIHGVVKDAERGGVYALDGAWPSLSWQQSP